MTDTVLSSPDFPGEDDWKGWAMLLSVPDDGTMRTVPACMRPRLERFMQTDPDHGLHLTPLGLARFLHVDMKTPWRGLGIEPQDVLTLLADGHTPAEILETAGELNAEREAALGSFRVPPAPTPTKPHLYFIRSADGPIKIGVSRDPGHRLRGLQTAHSSKLEMLLVVEGAADKEREYHQRFAAHRLHGEWFSPVPEILAEIASLQVPA